MSIDFIARGLASQAGIARVSSAARRHAFRIFGGRVAAARTISPSNTTFETIIGIACPADAIRLVFACGQTDSGDAVSAKVLCSAASIASSEDVDVQLAGTSAKQATFNAAGIGEFAPSSTSSRRKLYRSDWMALPSVSRTDGKAGGLYAIRTTLFTSGQTGQVVLLGKGADNFDNWATHPSGRVFRMRSKPATSSSNWSDFAEANSAPDNASPIVGVEYLARGKVVSVAGFGDSITEGRGTYLGEGFGMPACVSLSENCAGIAFEWSNLGWSGQSSSGIYYQVEDAIAFGLDPAIATLPIFTPNGFVSSPTQAAIDGMTIKLRQSADLLERAGAEIVTWTGTPLSPDTFALGSGDALRRQLNSNAVDAAARGAVVADFSSLIEGDETSNGQVRPAPGLLGDGIHPSDAGNARLAKALALAIRAQVSLPHGLLAA